MKIAYLDCFSGISGDMFLGALIDAGLPFEALERTLRTMALREYSLEVNREKRNGLSGTRFLVKVESGTHGHRGLKEITEIIGEASLSKWVKDKSIEIFQSLAREEGKIHDRPQEEIHFHEVGAVDSIIDIVGTVFGIEFLGIQSVFASHLPLGSGFVDTQHGRIPIPAPATIGLLQGIPVYDSGLKHELVTPTGAALVRGIAHSFGPLPPMVVERLGYGVGSRNLPDRPNLLRIMVGVDQPAQEVETVVILEANLDDTNPEWIGFLMERLFEAGALDVVFSAIQMKKNRPGVQLQVMGNPHMKDSLAEIIFKESTTLGIRFRYTQRKVLQRSGVEIDTPWGRVKAKKIIGPDGTPSIMPEFEACRRLAQEKGIPLKTIYYWIIHRSVSDNAF